jgi:hypothetical protein
MVGWKSKLRADPIDWLLGEDNPSVRYYTLKELLNKPANDPDVKRARSEIMKVGAVPEILAKKKKGGYWETPEGFYGDKYKGTVWQLIILAELGADGGEERIARTGEFILTNSQDRKSGGFSVFSAEGGGGSPDEVLPCLTGNMVWSLIRFGRLEDPRVQRGIDWIVRYQRFDDAIHEALKGWPYDRQGHPHCWGYTHTRKVHTCHMGVVKALKTFAEIPTNKRSNDVKGVIKKGVEYLLMHHIYKRSHDLNRISSPGWLRFGFPLMWNTDALEVLGILTKLGCRDGRMEEAVDLVISKQDNAGRWQLESTFNGRFQADIEKKGKPSKWVTLNALKVLKGYYN